MSEQRRLQCFPTTKMSVVVCFSSASRSVDRPCFSVGFLGHLLSIDRSLGAVMPLLRRPPGHPFWFREFLAAFVGGAVAWLIDSGRLSLVWSMSINSRLNLYKTLT